METTFSSLLLLRERERPHILFDHFLERKKLLSFQAQSARRAPFLRRSFAQHFALSTYPKVSRTYRHPRRAEFRTHEPDRERAHPVLARGPRRARRHAGRARRRAMKGERERERRFGKHLDARPTARSLFERRRDISLVRFAKVRSADVVSLPFFNSQSQATPESSPLGFTLENGGYHDVSRGDTHTHTRVRVQRFRAGLCDLRALSKVPIGPLRRLEVVTLGGLSQRTRPFPETPSFFVPGTQLLPLHRHERLRVRGLGRASRGVAFLRNPARPTSEKAVKRRFGESLKRALVDSHLKAHRRS